MKALDLVKILKNYPKGTKLYSTIYGYVLFERLDILEPLYPIVISVGGKYEKFIKEGKYVYAYDGECTLFPSKENRDWSKWKCPKQKFDPNTLQPFDKVLVRDDYCKWNVSLFSFHGNNYSICCNNTSWKYCIPFNEETKHLVGTKDKAPEFYRYWED